MQHPQLCWSPEAEGCKATEHVAEQETRQQRTTEGSQPGMRTNCTQGRHKSRKKQAKRERGEDGGRERGERGAGTNWPYQHGGDCSKTREDSDEDMTIHECTSFVLVQMFDQCVMLDLPLGFLEYCSCFLLRMSLKSHFTAPCTCIMARVKTASAYLKNKKMYKYTLLRRKMFPLRYIYLRNYCSLGDNLVSILRNLSCFTLITFNIDLQLLHISSFIFRFNFIFISHLKATLSNILP